MSTHEKYPKLQDKAYLKQMIVEAVYGSMALELQPVDKAQLESYVDKRIESSTSAQ